MFRPSKKYYWKCIIPSTFRHNSSSTSSAPVEKEKQISRRISQLICTNNLSSIGNSLFFFFYLPKSAVTVFLFSVFRKPIEQILLTSQQTVRQTTKQTKARLVKKKLSNRMVESVVKLVFVPRFFFFFSWFGVLNYWPFWGETEQQMPPKKTIFFFFFAELLLFLYAFTVLLYTF